MSNITPNHANNSKAIHEPLIQYIACSVSLPMHPQYRIEMQSSSVTPNGHLWQQVLAEMVNNNLLPIGSGYGTETKDKEEQIQKNQALIQLLKSWREEDEQEQHTTLEYLKRVLDEDRPSDRKLFP